jgi:hypothetical protein
VKRLGRYREYGSRVFQRERIFIERQIQFTDCEALPAREGSEVHVCWRAKERSVEGDAMSMRGTSKLL